MSDSAPPVPLNRRQQLERLLRTNPINLDAFIELATLYRDENRPAEARRILGQAIEVFPDNADLLFRHEEAVLARSLQQFREVTDLASRLGTGESDRELTRATHDWALRRIEVCRARLQRNPETLQLNVQLAEALIDVEQYDDAAEVLQRVVDHDEFSAAAHLLIARCHLAQGHDLVAMRHLRAAAMRRAVVAPPAIRVIALRLLVETASRLGIDETLRDYRAALATAESTLRNDSATNDSATSDSPPIDSPPTHSPRTDSPPASGPA